MFSPCLCCVAARPAFREPVQVSNRPVIMVHLVRTALAAAALLALTATGRAQSDGPYIVVDAATGAVLSQSNATLAWHPASTTKMMTAYVALRAVRAGRIGLETAIPASPLAARQPRVKVYIKPGQEITLDNALKVMMVKSANDIAYVVAEGVGGDVETFVGMMNAEARRLGMGDTRFTNPNGWHHPQQQTSARDLAVLTMAMMREFPEYAGYWGIGAVQLGPQLLNNTNGLIGRYEGATGFKTGFVCASGFNLVATATRGGRTVIAVVLGAYSGAERTVRAAQLLDSGFTSWGGFSTSLASLSPSGTTARSICAEVRAFGRGAPLADDQETFGPLSATLSSSGGGEGGATMPCLAARRRQRRSPVRPDGSPSVRARNSSRCRSAMAAPRARPRRRWRPMWQAAGRRPWPRLPPNPPAASPVPANAPSRRRSVPKASAALARSTSREATRRPPPPRPSPPRSNRPPRRMARSACKAPSARRRPRRSGLRRRPASARATDSRPPLRPPPSRLQAQRPARPNAPATRRPTARDRPPRRANAPRRRRSPK